LTHISIRLARFTKDYVRTLAKINKDVASDITSNMIPLLIFGSVGTKWALILGLVTSEILMHYWNSRKLPPEVHALGRSSSWRNRGVIVSVFSILG
jgi:hypothetical protein